MTRLAPLACAAILLTAATLSTTACAQPGGSGGQQGAARSGVNPDSVLARAERSRYKGSDSASMMIVEVSDFQCPFCREFAATTYPRVDSAYVRTGRARMLYIHLPLASHQQAFAAAEASMCAGAQDKFWPMHDRLFATQREWSGQANATERFEAFARELRLDMEAYRDCTRNDRVASLIVNDAMQAASAGIQGTPMFILSARGTQRILSGAVPFEQFAAAVDSILNAPAAQSPAPPSP
jgi:protein-disulfide isomerase